MKIFKKGIVSFTALILAVLIVFLYININMIMGETQAPDPEVTGQASPSPSDVSQTPDTSTAAPSDETTGAPETTGPAPSETTPAPAETSPAPAKTTPAGTSPAPVKTTPAKTTPAASVTPSPTPRPTENHKPSKEPTIPSNPAASPEPTVPVVINPGQDVQIKNDMRGYVIRIAGWWDEEKSNTRIIQLIEQFEKDHNCQVLFMDLNQKDIWNSLLESKATGEPFADAVFLEGNSVLTRMVPFNLLAPLSPYYTDDEINKIPSSYLKNLSTGGKLYAVPARIPDFSGLWINRDILAASKMPDVNELFMNGTWTWDKFGSIMYNTTLDRDNSGYYDLFGLSVGVDLYPGLVASGGGSIVRWDGIKFVSGIQAPRSVAALDFVRNIYENNYIGSDNEKPFYMKYSGIMTGESWMTSQLKNYLSNSNLMFVPYPAAKAGEGYIALAQSAPVIGLVESGLHKEETAALIKRIYSTSTFTSEKKSFYRYLNVESENAYENMLTNFTFDYSKAFFDDMSLRNSLMSDIQSGNINADLIAKNYVTRIEDTIKTKQKQVNLSRLPVEIDW